MKLLTAALPLGTALLIVMVFSRLPELKTCVLPVFRREERQGRVLPEREATGFPAHLPIFLITLIYAATAFFNLGDLRAPQSFQAMEGETAVLSLETEAQPCAVMLYCGVGQGDYLLEARTEGGDWVHAGDFSQGHVEVLKWHSFNPDFPEGTRELRLVWTSGQPWLGEVLLLDGDGAPIPVSCDHPLLCDEQDLAPVRQTFRNSSYFDEIYHARTAWEHLNDVQPYEISHPPLGKEIIGLGIRLFGMTPFGWRFMGTLCGVLMLPLLYVFLRKLFGGRVIPCCGAVVFATDFMHYVQTRIATVDSYSVFFILLMYLFLYLWLTEDSLPALALCGISFGLGAAAKWTSIYAGLGLALLWAGHWIGRFAACRRPSPAVGKGKKRRPAQPLPEPPVGEYWRNVGFCLIFFVLVPCLIYYLSYIPYGRVQGLAPFRPGYLKIVLDNQSYMFNYHSGIQATHPYSSRWYEWLVDVKPILYYLDYGDGNLKSSIAAFLNPLLCWAGLLSLFVLTYTAVARRDRTAGFLLVGYLSQLLPWVLIRRLTFAYHYFPSSLFLVLGLCYVFTLLRDNVKGWRTWVFVLTGLSAALFLLFFPTLNGLYEDRTLAAALMKWLPTWPL